MQIRDVDNSSAQQGSILVIVLVSLLVATMLGAGLIKTVLVHHRQMCVRDGQQQSLWLAEAGLQRAARQLASTPEYKGETWEVPADVLGSSRTAVVTIEAGKSAEGSNEWEVRVKVVLDDARTQPTGYQREHRFVMEPDKPDEP